MEISTSFSRKINLANYGGAAYESEDVFVSMKDSLPEGATKEEKDAKTDELYYKCVEAVEAFLTERINNLKK